MTARETFNEEVQITDSSNILDGHESFIVATTPTPVYPHSRPQGGETLCLGPPEPITNEIENPKAGKEKETERNVKRAAGKEEVAGGYPILKSYKLFNITHMDLESTDEWNFLLRSWKCSMRQRYQSEPDNYYFSWMQRVIVKVKCRGAQFLVARHMDYPSQVFGVAAIESDGEVVHFVYVKKWFRRRGLAKALLTALPKAPRFATQWNSISAACDGLARTLNIERIDL